MGRWRNDAAGSLQIVSGPIGRECIHFGAPPAERLNREMREFLAWFNAPTGTEPLLKAGLAQLRFATVHPFKDGNGRIARAVADMVLARSEASPERFYRISSQIRAERTAHYTILERTQRGTTDVSEWLEWFLGCLGRAIDSAQATLGTVLRQARLRERLAELPVNDRQRRILNRFADGFSGKLTSSKWAKLARCSHDTALRDLVGLVELGILVRGPAGGRSSSYAWADGGVGAEG